MISYLYNIEFSIYHCKSPYKILCVHEIFMFVSTIRFASRKEQIRIAFELCGAQAAITRYWEVKGVIASEKDSEGSTRKFNYLNVKKILLIQELVEEGFTLDAAAKKVEDRMKNLNQAFFKLVNSSSNNNEPK
jgi:hypothetical protein